MNIQKLTIYSSNSSALASFYTDVLGVILLEKTEDAIHLQIGKSLLIVKHQEKVSPSHFAINIPANKATEALTWLKTKVDILKNEGQEIQHFHHWNAEAMYFYDTDRNIVELIARKNLNNPSPEPFDARLFLELSEIGIVTKNIENTFKQLTENTETAIYFGNFNSFCAIGDEHGLFICVNKNYWFPTKDRAYPADFKMEMLVKGKEYNIEFKGGVLSIQ